jgi:hypothetical protein
MAQIKVHYSPKPMAEDSSLVIGVTLAGFLCTVGGTITVTDADGTTLLDAFPALPAMGFIRIPLLSKTNAGMTVTLAGGCAGTLFT